MKKNESKSSENNAQATHREAIKKAVESFTRKRKIGERLPTYTGTEIQSPSGLSIATFKQNENTAFVMVTDEVEETTVHYVDGVAGETGLYVRCNGDDCVMCRAGRKQISLLMMPAYDLRQKSLVVIRGTSSEDANSLFNQIGRIVTSELPDAPPIFLNIQKMDRYNYKVTSHKVDPRLLESESIKTAREAVKDSHFSATSLIESRSNEELLTAFPVLKTDLELFGHESYS